MKIAVTGSTGRIGGHIVRLLESSGEHDVTALTRRTAAYDDPAALRRALRDIGTLVFVSSDGEAAKVVLHHENVLRAAADCEVGHVVLLSGVDADVESPFCYAFTNGHTEQVLRDSGMAFSIARASIFTEFFLGLVRQVAVDGTVRLPAAGGRVSLVSREDVAECLAALALAGPTGRHHDLTGPDCLDASAIAKHAGYEHADVDLAEFAGALLRGGEEPWWVYAYSSMFSSIREKRWETVSDEVSRLTGRRPLSVQEVLTRP
jgi:NAD(P)H dehydrogenase (quinone)